MHPVKAMEGFATALNALLRGFLIICLLDFYIRFAHTNVKIFISHSLEKFCFILPRFDYLVNIHGCHINHPSRVDLYLLSSWNSCKQSYRHALRYAFNRPSLYEFLVLDRYWTTN